MSGLPAIELPSFHVCDVRVQFVELPHQPGITVKVSASITDVKTGERGYVQNDRICPYDDHLLRVCPRERLADFAWRALREMLLHELDECLFVDGKRRCLKPHPDSEPLTLEDCTVTRYRAVQYTNAFARIAMPDVMHDGTFAHELPAGVP